jgi:hypothetical protein
MQMSDLEIVNKFKKADNKVGHITILAQLNGCPEDTIREILRKGGIPETEIPMPKSKRKTSNRNTAPAKEKVDESVKNGSVFEEEPKLTEEEQRMLDKALSIPTPVADAVLARLNKLKNKIQKYEQECETLEAFLEGEI